MCCVCEQVARNPVMLCFGMHYACGDCAFLAVNNSLKCPHPDCVSQLSKQAADLVIQENTQLGSIEYMRCTQCYHFIVFIARGLDRVVCACGAQYKTATAQQTSLPGRCCLCGEQQNTFKICEKHTICRSCWRIPEDTPNKCPVGGCDNSIGPDALKTILEITQLDQVGASEQDLRLLTCVKCKSIYAYVFSKEKTAIEDYFIGCGCGAVYDKLNGVLAFEPIKIIDFCNKVVKPECGVVVCVRCFSKASTKFPNVVTCGACGYVFCGKCGEKKQAQQTCCDEVCNIDGYVSKMQTRFCTFVGHAKKQSNVFKF